MVRPLHISPFESTFQKPHSRPQCAQPFGLLIVHYCSQCLSADPFLDEEKLFRAMLQSTQYDVVVLGMGDWPASSTVQPRGLWPFARYRRHIDALVKDLQGFGQSGWCSGSIVAYTVVVWMELSS